MQNCKKKTLITTSSIENKPYIYVCVDTTLEVATRNMLHVPVFVDDNKLAASTVLDE